MLSYRVIYFEKIVFQAGIDSHETSSEELVTRRGVVKPIVKRQTSGRFDKIKMAASLLLNSVI